MRRCKVPAFYQSQKNKQSKMYLIYPKFGKRFAIWTILIILGYCQHLNGQQISVMSYNIHHGANREEQLTLKEMGNFILDSQVDIIGLQEVDSVCHRSGSQDQMRELSKITGMEHTFARHFAYQGGAYGLGILSKFPMKDIRNDRITSISSDGKRNTLALLSAKICLPNDQELIFATVHFALDQPTRKIQAEEVLKYLDTHLPVILTGDLNAEPGTAEIGLFLEKFHCSHPPEKLTFPEIGPSKKIDYILFSKTSRPKIKWTKVYAENRLSDHLPIVAQVELNPIYPQP
ncbi:MAG: endonuclease/exonuclease/phosphatase family protein [Cyclobacteriaceae bacterium]